MRQIRLRADARFHDDKVIRTTEEARGKVCHRHPAEPPPQNTHHGISTSHASRQPYFTTVDSAEALAAASVELISA